MASVETSGQPGGGRRSGRGNSVRNADAARRSIADAAYSLFAERSPDQVSTREIGGVAGYSHTLVGRYFGAKANLELLVAERVVTEYTDIVDAACAECGDGWPFLGILERLTARPATARLLVRCVLGELPAAPLSHPTAGPDRIVDLIAARRPGGGPETGPTDAARFGAFASLGILLGWLSLERFYTAACRLQGVPRAVIVPAVADACDRTARAFATERADLDLPRTRRVRPAPARPPVGRGTAPVRAALLASTVDLLAEPGPAAISTREIARHAGVNQGQIYHLFGSREELIAAAFSASTDGFIDSTITDGSLDVVAATQEYARSHAPRLITRLLANDVPIESVRPQFPVFDSLLARYPEIPTGEPRDGLSDPRLAVLATGAFYQGSMVWESVLRASLGIGSSVDLRPAIETVIQDLLSIPEHG